MAVTQRSLISSSGRLCSDALLDELGLNENRRFIADIGDVGDFSADGFLDLPVRQRRVSFGCILFSAKIAGLSPVGLA